MEMRHFAGYFASIKVEYECSLSNQHFQCDYSHPKYAHTLRFCDALDIGIKR